MDDAKKFLAKEDFRLKDFDPDDTGSLDEDDVKDESKKIDSKLDKLQETLYAEHKQKLLIVLQGMDTSGKDGVIRRVFQGMNPSGIRVAHFREPSQDEIDHGFLWRAYAKIPSAGEIVIFNRSHYEGVLVEKVHKLAPDEVIKNRYKEICQFEKLIREEGVTTIKFFLYISSEEQKKRLEERLEDETKEWKFSESDLQERKYWDEYMEAYEHALRKTSSDHAPWYVIPSNHRWFRDLVVSRILVKTLEDMDMKLPRLPKKLREVKIQ